MKLDVAKIENLMGQVYDALQSIDDKAANSETKRQFVFHMTDWLDNLESLVKLYEEGAVRKEKAAQTVAGFLYHVIPHLNAAGQLLLDRIPEPLKEDQQESKPS